MFSSNDTDQIDRRNSKAIAVFFGCITLIISLGLTVIFFIGNDALVDTWFISATSTYWLITIGLLFFSFKK